MKPSERLLYIRAAMKSKTQYESIVSALAALEIYLDEQYDIINSTNQMKKTKVNKLKLAKTAVAKKAIKKAKKK